MLTLHDISSVATSSRARSLPGVECCLALWTASAPEPEPLSSAVQRILTQIPSRRRRTAARLGRTLPGWPLHAASWFCRTEASDFRAALEELRAECAARLAFDLVVGPLVGPDPRAGVSDGRSKRMAPVLRRPDDVVAEVMEVIEAFWAAGFSRLWEQQQPRQRVLVEHIAPSVGRDVVRALLAISPRAAHDEEHDRLVFLGGQCEWSVSCSALDGLDVLPSLWLRRRVVALYLDNRIGLCIPALPTLQDRIRPDQVAALLGALAEPRRLEIVKLCTQRARSTQELARCLGITEAPVSRHLKQLERQGLVVGQRFGREVTYAALPEEIALLADALRNFSRNSLTPVPESTVQDADAGTAERLTAAA